MQLNQDAFVYHKRRSTFKSFFRQVFRFGAARVNIFRRHSKELKFTHLFPALFTLSLFEGILVFFDDGPLAFWYYGILGLYLLLLLVHSSYQNKSIKVGFLSVVASILQLIGYGSGFIANFFSILFMGRKNGIDLGASK